MTVASGMDGDDPFEEIRRRLRRQVSLSMPDLTRLQMRVLPGTFDMAKMQRNLSMTMPDMTKMHRQFLAQTADLARVQRNLSIRLPDVTKLQQRVVLQTAPAFVRLQSKVLAESLARQVLIDTAPPGLWQDESGSAIANAWIDRNCWAIVIFLFFSLVVVIFVMVDVEDPALLDELIRLITVPAMLVPLAVTVYKRLKQGRITRRPPDALEAMWRLR